MTQFQLTRYGDMWLITILVEGPIRDPFYLGHSSTPGGHSWSTDKADGKRFQYAGDAIQYALTHTNIRRFRHPLPPAGWLEVRYDERKVFFSHGAYISFDDALAVSRLPIFKGPTE